jgi:hypothetical protein
MAMTEENLNGAERMDLLEDLGYRAPVVRLALGQVQ